MLVVALFALALLFPPKLSSLSLSHTHTQDAKALPVLHTLIEFGGKLFLSDVVDACRALEASISRADDGAGLPVRPCRTPILGSVV